MTAEQEKFEARTKASLDASVFTLDKKTQDDLASIRQKALKAQQPKPWISFNALVPAGAFAFCALLTVFLLYSPNHIDDTTQQVAIKKSTKGEQAEQIAMLELLTNPEDLETTIDPDFYVWVDEVLATESIDNAVYIISM